MLAGHVEVWTLKGTANSTALPHKAALPGDGSRRDHLQVVDVLLGVQVYALG